MAIFLMFFVHQVVIKRILFSTSSRQRWEMPLALGLAMDGDNSFHTLEAPWSGCGSLGLAYRLKLVLPKPIWDNQIKQYQTIRHRVIYISYIWHDMVSKSMQTRDDKSVVLEEPMASPSGRDLRSIPRFGFLWTCVSTGHQIYHHISCSEKPISVLKAVTYYN